MTEHKESWSNFFNEEWLAASLEPALDPDVPVVDSAHHLMVWPVQFEMEETRGRTNEAGSTNWARAGIVCGNVSCKVAAHHSTRRSGGIGKGTPDRE